MSNEHDGSYKYLFSNPELVRDLIMGFIPDEWLHSLDYSTLERVNASYVTDDLKQRHDDIIWRVKIGGQWTYLYLLIEFQSSVEKYMALRLLVYQGLLYQDLIKSGEVRGDDLLPPILPIVLYNGKERWTAATDVFDLIQTVPGMVEQFKLKAKHIVIDKNTYQDQDKRLASEKNLVAAVFSLEDSNTPEAMQALIARLQEWLADKPGLRRTFAHWIRRALLRSQEYSIVLPEVHDLLELRIMLADTVERWAHFYKAEGMEAGKAEGKAEGKVEGKAEGKAEGIQEGEMLSLQKLLIKRFGSVPAHINAQIASAKQQEIERWFDRAIDAKQLSDIFEQ
jgi:predicted transposase/invertase (TIGR01784 family)